MLRLLHVLVVAALVFAAADVYKIKFDSTLQAEKVAKLRAEVRRERDAIAALRATWSELDNPERLQGLARRHLPLKPIDTAQYDTLDRLPLPAPGQAARDYAARRFPALAGTPVIAARVCQYDLSPDSHFVVDRHPERPSWWLVGGGSGHSFKHAPALAEYLADCAEGSREPEPFHGIGPRNGDAELRTSPRHI